MDLRLIWDPQVYLAKNYTSGFYFEICALDVHRYFNLDSIGLQMDEYILIK